MPLTEAQAEALVEQLADDAALLHGVVHGDDETEVVTESGTVPSVAKVIAAAEDALTGSIAQAEAWADKAEDEEVETDKYSARHWAAKAQAVRDSLVNVVQFRGAFDASTGSYPSDPEQGDLYTVTVSGVVGGTALVAGDEIIYGPSGWIFVGRNRSASEIVALLEGNFTDAAHGNRGGGGLHANATTSIAGFMSAADKSYLDGLPDELAAKADASFVISALAEKADANRAVPSGGSTGQYLAKKSASDFDGEWVSPPAAQAWGEIPGTLSNQTDLQSALNQKIDISAAREKLTADRTYYVRADGSDSNDGLTDSSGGAFLTIQRAIDVIHTVDLGGFQATIQVGDGTYTGNILVNKPFVGGLVFLVGNTTTPANVLISHNTFRAFFLGGSGVRLNVSGVKIENSAAGALGTGINIEAGAMLEIGGPVNFGACTRNHIEAILGAVVLISASYTISGGAGNHITLTSGAAYQLVSHAITLTGSPSFSGSFCSVQSGAAAIFFGLTVVGAATGSRYYAALNGVINVFAGGANYLPGNSAGSVATGGQYA